MKRFIAILCAFVFCLSFTACDGGESEEIEKLKKEIKELESKLEAYENNDNVKPDDADTDNIDDAIPNIDKDGSFIACIGDSIALDFVEISLLEYCCTEEILPSDTSGVYSYVADEEGEQYWCLVGNLKNTHGEEYDVEDMVAELCFDNKYTYKAHLKADDGGNDFYGNNVKPLDSVKFYIYASVPDEMIEAYSSCTVKFGFNESFSGSYYDDFEDCDYVYKVTIKK